MIPDDTPERCIETIMNAHYDGADAFGFQLEDRKPKHLNEEAVAKQKALIEKLHAMGAESCCDRYSKNPLLFTTICNKSQKRIDKNTK